MHQNVNTTRLPFIHKNCCQVNEMMKRQPVRLGDMLKTRHMRWI